MVHILEHSFGFPTGFQSSANASFQFRLQTLGGIAPSSFTTGQLVMELFKAGNVGIGTNNIDPKSLLGISQTIAGIGTLTINGTIITGVGTQFTNTFKIGDTLTVTPTTTAWSSGTAYVIGNVVTNGGNMYNVTTAGTGGTGPTGTSTTPTQFGGAGAFFTYVAPTYTISAIASDTSMTISPTATLSAASSYTLTGGSRFNVYGNGNVAWGTPGTGGTSATMWYDARYGALNIGTSTQQSSYQVSITSVGTLTSALNISTPTGSSVTNGISLDLIGRVGNAYGISINNTSTNQIHGIIAASRITDLITGTAVRAFNVTTTGASYVTYNGGKITGSNLIYGGISVVDQSSSPFSFSAVSNGVTSANAIIRSYNLSHQASVFQSSANGTQLLNSYNYMAGNGSSYNYVETNQFGSILLDNTYIASNKVTKTGFVWATTVSGTMSEAMRLSGINLIIGSGSADDGINILQVSGRTKLNGQVSYGGSTPTIAAGTGAGTSPTISIVGTNNGGVITVTTGTLPSSSATLVTITYTGAFATGSQIILYPTNATTALLSGVSMVYTTGTTTTFTITSGATALTAATTYSWAYVVTGY